MPFTKCPILFNLLTKLYFSLTQLFSSYESMAIMGSTSNVNYADLSNMIDEICRRYGHIHNLLLTVQFSSL